MMNSLQLRCKRGALNLDNSHLTGRAQLLRASPALWTTSATSSTILIGFGNFFEDGVACFGRQNNPFSLSFFVSTRASRPRLAEAKIRALVPRRPCAGTVNLCGKHNQRALWSRTFRPAQGAKRSDCPLRPRGDLKVVVNAKHARNRISPHPSKS